MPADFFRSPTRARLAAVSLSAFVASGTPAHAVDCSTTMNNAELIVCSEQEFERADAELNVAYREALAAIAKTTNDPPYDAKKFEAALRASQRAWVAWRVAECEGLIPMFWTGGTGVTGEVLGCMTEKTEARTKEIRQRFEPQ